MEMDKHILAQDFNTRSLLLFSLPTMVMMVFMGLYTVVDTIFVSRFAGTDALAAVNIVCPVTNLVVGLGTMLATGGNALIAGSMGAGKIRQAREIFTLLILCSAAAGIVIAAAVFVWMDLVLHWLGASRNLLGYAKAYLKILVFFLPWSLLQTVFVNLFVTAGHGKLGSVLAAAGGVLNLVLDDVFIVRMGMGISGAALGTGLGYLAPAAAGILFFAVSRREALYFCRTRWQLRVIGECCFNGSSEMVGQMAAAITTFLFNRTMLRLVGEDGVAAITVMIYTQFLLSTLYIGFSMGAAPVLAFHHGSGNRELEKKVLGIGLRITGASSLLLFLAAFCGGGELVQLFVSREQDVWNLAAAGFRIFSFSFLFCGPNIVISAMLTALSEGKLSAVLSFLRTFVFLTAGILLLPRVWGVNGVWMAVPAAEGTAAVVSILLVCWYFRSAEISRT